jgi:protein ImuB
VQSNLVDGANGTDDLADLIDRLGVRFGPRRVRQLAFAESHIPEYAVTERAPASWPEAARPSGNTQQQAVQDACGPTRPLRLFERPEPIDAIAEVPDGPPVRFRWRRVPHEVAHAEGPERIAMEWWRDETGRSLTRDYFRVEDREGRRFWLYREGLFGSETTRPQWYVHGLFA